MSAEFFADAQWYIDRKAELPYEIVRRFGNVMLSRAWLAGSLAGGARWKIRAEGLIEMDRLRRTLEDLGVELREEAEMVRLTVAGAGVRFSASILEVTMPGGRAAPPASPELLEELKAAGFGGGDAVWMYVRDGADIPFLARAGVEKATLRVSFAKGAVARAEATCRDEEAAATLVADLQTLKQRLATAVSREAEQRSADGSPALVDPEAVVRVATLLRSIEVGAKGKKVTVRLTAVESVDRLYAYALAIAACLE